MTSSKLTASLRKESWQEPKYVISLAFLVLLFLFFFSGNLSFGITSNNVLPPGDSPLTHEFTSHLDEDSGSTSSLSMFTCTKEQSLQQVNWLRAHESKCPGHDWWPHFIQASMACAPVVVVNIGANKGYSLASFADYFAPELGVTPAAIGPSVESTGAMYPCGACNDCSEGHLASKVSRTCVLAGGEVVPASHFPLSIHGFEPIPGNIDILNSGVVRLFKERANGKDIPASNWSLSVHRFAAVGNAYIKTVPFGQCPPGLERCGVEKEGTAGEKTVWAHDKVMIEEVPAFTVDTLSERVGIGADDIDILAIDTEGLDPEVLDGASGMLATNRIKIIEFEYLNQRAWKERTLEGVVEVLGGFGYDCFLAQAKSLIRLTGCWNEAYEFKSWSNVICVLRSNKGLVAVAHTFTHGI